MSIISSFFNAHRYFEETYKSVINQTFQNLEWIIVDDCSTDPEAILLFKSLSYKTPKIKTFYHQCNQGVSAGRNTAISHASGKYLFFTDLDDILDPTYIEKCVLFLENHPDFSFVNSYSIGFHSQEYWWTHGFDKPSQFIQQNWVTGRLLYRKADFDQLGGFDTKLRFYEDWERWLRAITNYQKGWTIPEYLDCYRRTESGLLAISRNNVTEEQRVTELIQSRYQAFFRENRLPDLCLKRPSAFDANLRNFQIEVKNPLGRDSSGKHILCFFPWLEVGGADKFNLDLINLLGNRGYDITIATTFKSEHPWHQHFYSLTPDIFHLPNFLQDSHWLAFARYIIESRQIDIVFISNSYIAYYLLPFLRQEFPDVTFVDYVHTYDPGWCQCGYPRVSCQLSQFLDCQVVSSKWLSDFYKKLKPETESKLRVCYTNEDTKAWTPNQKKREALRSRLEISDDTVVLLFPARMVAQKRPTFLVDIVKELVSQSLPVSVITLGEGELLAEMQAKVVQLRLESVFHILPPTEPELMIDFYSVSDILLLPTEYEGISLTIYEAMSMQLPVVASNVGGQSELVTPETGFLITKGNGDADEVQAYLKVLVPLIQNSELREKIGFFARQRIADFFSLEAMGDRMEEIFAEAIKLRKITPPEEIDPAMAEEMLVLALEYFEKEELLGSLWREKCQIEQERDKLSHEKYQIEQERDKLSHEKYQIEQERDKLSHEKYQIEQERHELWWKKNAMETSKFWKLRKLWFKVKRRIRLTQEEP
ncbi:glycosyltransferase [Tolypothrix sp. NIES-4075]|uniref:glycosyltransferase n=1 Tax=Tolypothrix sp. NIES-4075 TaxID=2005459 RepID=UPI001F29D662|nr:glycosyltransferase [Tolypothrix sp. NIES-4075]